MKSEVKHLLLGMFLGSLTHFGARELAHYIQADRYIECRKTQTKEACKEANKHAPLWERVVLFELDWLSGQD